MNTYIYVERRTAQRRTPDLSMIDMVNKKRTTAQPELDLSMVGELQPETMELMMFNGAIPHLDVETGEIVWDLSRIPVHEMEGMR